MYILKISTYWRWYILNTYYTLSILNVYMKVILTLFVSQQEDAAFLSQIHLQNYFSTPMLFYYAILGKIR